jgi:hypothetical protein
MSNTPENPGSLASYIAERTHHAVMIAPHELEREYVEKLTGFRHAIAAQRGVSLDDLHAGVRQEQSYDKPATAVDEEIASA